MTMATLFTVMSNSDELPANVSLPISHPGSPLSPISLRVSSPEHISPSPSPPQFFSGSPGTPPGLVTVSNSGDSESDYSAPYSQRSNMTFQFMITTLLPPYICEQGKPPVITPGKLTPDLLFNFENGALIRLQWDEPAKWMIVWGLVDPFFSSLWGIMKYKRYNEYGGFLIESDLIWHRVRQGNTGWSRVKFGRMHTKWYNDRQSCARAWQGDKCQMKFKGEITKVGDSSSSTLLCTGGFIVK